LILPVSALRVHEITFDAAVTGSAACARIAALPGSDYLITNGQPYAEGRSLPHGIIGVGLMAVYGVSTLNIYPNPNRPPMI